MLFDSRNHLSLLFIFSRSLHTQLVKAIGLQFSGLVLFLPGFGIGITIAFLQLSGNT